MSTIEFILESTYFKFDGVIYKQVFGTPMGSPLSPVVADLVLRRLEIHALKLYKDPLPFFYRYVDDLILAIPKGDNDRILRCFNSFHSRLQFTLEEGGKELNYLEVTVTAKEDRLSFNWYRKPTFSGRFLNFGSKHPLNQKIGIIIGMVDKIILIADRIHDEENLNTIINILLSNDYPIRLVFDTINSRLRYHAKKREISIREQSSDPEGEEERTYWLTVPYINETSERLRILNNENVKIAFSSINKLSRYIKVHKDTISNMDKKDTVYKLQCRNCDVTYVGQTGRHLRTRVTEHKNQIRWNTNVKSVVTEHRLLTGHDFDWESVQILDEEHIYSKRLMSEMIHIKRQKSGINLQTDTEGLHSAFLPFIRDT